MNASSEGSTIADSKGGLKNGRNISKVSEKKNCHVNIPFPLSKELFSVN